MNIDLLVNWKLNAKIQKLEKNKIESLASQDAISYYNAISKLGCDIEDKPLYEKGLAEKIYYQWRDV